MPQAPSPTPTPELVTSPCDPSSLICDYVYAHTHHAWLADLAKIVITRPLPILAIIVGAILIRWLVHRFVDAFVAQATAQRAAGRIRFGLRTRRALGGVVGGAERRIQRTEALGSVLRSISSVIIYSTALVMILEQLGVNLGPLIASASIAGIAFGFGAQSLVKDVLSGTFALLEDQYGVGDVIEVDGTSGVVEAVTLRTTRLRDVHGTVWFVRNGEITKPLGNFSQNWARTVLDVVLSWKSDPDTAIAVIGKVAADVHADPEFADLILEEPEVWGIEDLGVNSMTVRLVVKTAPLRQWDVARELRRRLRYELEDAGLEVGTPKQIVVLDRGLADPVSSRAPRSEAGPGADAATTTSRARTDDPGSQLRP